MVASDMFSTVLKKTVYFVIDNFRALFVLNAVMLFSLILAMLLPILFTFIPFSARIMDIPVLFFAGAGLGVMQAAAIAGAMGFLVRGLLKGVKPDVKGFVKGLAQTWKKGLMTAGLFWLSIALLAAIFQVVGILFGVLGFLTTSILFWLFLCLLSCAQFFFSFQLAFSGSLFSLIRKLFYFYIDNTLYSLTVLGTNILIAAASPLLLGTGIGGATALVFTDVALSLRLSKYAYLDAHPKAAGKPIPWDQILLDENKTLGSRALREILPSFIGDPKSPARRRNGK